MLKKDITYLDFNGESTTEPFYFNLTAAELARMELSASDNTTAGMQDYLNRIIKSGKGQDILDAFEKFITASYGQRSPDGRRFTKSPEILADFKATGAYDALFLQMVTDAEAGSQFVNGIMPADLAEQAQKIIEQQKREQGGISQNLQDHLGDEGVKGETPHLAIVDEVTDIQPKPASGKNQSKEVLVAKMKIKAGRPVTITDELMDNLTADELNQAMENGSTLA